MGLELIVAALALTTGIKVDTFNKIKQEKEWNKGRCPHCGNKWKFQPNFSDGHQRCYTCDECHNIAVFTKNVDK